jgi:hypothetical protein
MVVALCAGATDNSSTNIPSPGKGEAPGPRPSTNGYTKIIVREIVQLTTNRSAELTVVTIYEGASAENFRATVTQQSRQQISKSRLALYARAFPLLQPQKPIVIEDHGAQMRVVECYTIPSSWQYQEGYRWTFDMDAARTITALLDIPEAQRQAPLSVIAAPAHILHTTTVTFPARIRFNNEKQFVTGPADQLSFKRTSRQRSVTQEYEYRTRTNSVPVERIAEHIDAHNRMRNLAGLSLSWVPPSPSTGDIETPHGPVIWIGVCFASAMFIASRVLSARRNVD